MNTAAFFDMDRTLVRCNSGTLWLRYLRSRGEITRLRLLRALGWNVQYKLAILDMEKVAKRVIADLAGQGEAELIEKCRVFTESLVLRHLSPRAEEAIARHRQAGHLIAILSSSTPYVIAPLARRLAIEHVLCTRLSVRDGKFDGTVVAPACYGAGKVHWAESFAAAQSVDLQRSFFYTDSYSDLPMLERVGIARVVNPDTRLRRHARRVGWPVETW